MRKNLSLKIKESLSAVIPITMIVLILGVSLIPMTGEMVFLFILGSVLLIVGIGLFTMGADTSMLIMGERIGTEITKTKKLLLISISCLVIGILITVAEPDLRILADAAPIVEDWLLIISVAAGVGIFLLIAFLRIFLKIKLSYLFIGFYILIFSLAFLPVISENFVPTAFDSGGVTTGPITVPFILSLGLGLAAIRGDKDTQDDTFGLVALCSIGPILTVLILGIFSGNTEINAELAVITEHSEVGSVFREFLNALPHYFGETGIAVLPIIGLCILFQFIAVKMDKKSFLKVMTGFILTYFGLALFLTGVNVGFLPVGQYIGLKLAESDFPWVLIPLGGLMGYFIVAAEPAVHLLKEQVENITEGRIKGSALGKALSAGIAVSVAIAMIRVLTGISIMWFLIPGYAFSLIMTFFVPHIFTAVAFDSGGVASGPMTATFLLPFAMGACAGTEGGIMATDAFGLVAMVAMTPLITIQLLGLWANVKERVKPAEEFSETIPEDIVDTGLAALLDDDIVDI